MLRWTSAAGLVFLALVVLGRPANAHSGAPYPILLDEPLGTYRVTALADPDVGIGTFILTVETAESAPAPQDTEVLITVKPLDRHREPVTYRARRVTTPQGEQFVAAVPFDARGVWEVHLLLEGSAGRGETTVQVEVTPPGPRWWGTLLCMLPFIALGALWVLAALRSQRRPGPPSSPAANST